MKKKYMLFLLALLPLVASSAPVQIKGIYYNLNTETGEAEVTNSMGGSDQAPKSYSGSVDIPSSVNFGGIEYSVTSIGDYAFYMCKGMTSITIPNTVTSMGESAFQGCNGLQRVNISDCESWCKIVFSGYTSNPLNFSQRLYIDGEEVVDLVIPGSVTSIADYAFIGCTNLASVTIGEGVTSIGEGAFLYCTGLKSVTIPASVTSIGEWAFLYCNSLTSVTSWITEPFEINEDIFYADANSFTSATLYVPKGTKEKYEATPAWNKFQNIEELIVKIGGLYYFLNQATNEAEVTNSMGGYSEDAEKYSGSVVIPPTVTYNGEEYTVRTIGECAFFGCTDLTSITMPESVSTLKIDAFGGCTGLTSITIPNSVTKIDLLVFSACSGLTSIIIGDNVETIGSFAFAGCSGLTSVTIPNSVKVMENEVFYQCTGLTSVTLGSGLTSIGELAFLSCSSLASVTSLITDPFEINENVFYTDATSFTSATLYVPKGTKEKYEATPAWNLFQKIEEIEVTEKKGDVNGDGAVDVADIATIIDVMAGKALQYKGKADVNGDHTVDVADISSVIDIMAGK